MLSMEEMVRKELREEIGASCEQIKYVNSFYTAVGQSNQEFHVYLALGVEFTEEPQLEETENIEVCSVPAQEALRRALTHFGSTEPAEVCRAIFPSRITKVSLLKAMRCVADSAFHTM